MTKRPPLSAIRDRHALIAIWRALEGDPMFLAGSLRRGTASTAEQKLAADLIEGKITPRRPRSWASNRETWLQIARDYAFLKKACAHLPKRERQEKNLKGEIATASGVSPRHLDNILAEFDDKALAEVARIDSQPSRLKRGFVAGEDRDTLEQITAILRDALFARSRPLSRSGRSSRRAPPSRSAIRRRGARRAS